MVGWAFFECQKILGGGIPGGALRELRREKVGGAFLKTPVGLVRDVCR